MHRSSIKHMAYFRDKYVSLLSDPTILDVGSRRMSSRSYKLTYRDVFFGYKYTGMDIVPGRNVDIVGYENIKAVYDVLISGQVMEHVKQPWHWLTSLTPYFKKYICVIAPHTCAEHRLPIDTYRYFPDGMRDLFDYAGTEEVEIIKDKYETVGIGKL